MSVCRACNDAQAVFPDNYCAACAVIIERDLDTLCARQVLMSMHKRNWKGTDQLAAYINHLSREDS